MSEMKLDVICRIKIKGSYDEESALRFCAKFGFQPELEDEFYFETSEGFNFSLFEDRLYLDYYFQDNEDMGDINIDFDENRGMFVVEKMEEIFGNSIEPLEMYIEKFKFKVLYYYNGGCAGACEVE